MTIVAPAHDSDPAIIEAFVHEKDIECAGWGALWSNSRRNASARHRTIALQLGDLGIQLSDASGMLAMTRGSLRTVEITRQVTEAGYGTIRPKSVSGTVLSLLMDEGIDRLEVLGAVHASTWLRTNCIPSFETGDRAVHDLTEYAWAVGKQWQQALAAQKQLV